MFLGKLDALRRWVDTVDAFKAEAPETLAEQASATPDVERRYSGKRLVISLTSLRELLYQMTPNEVDSQLVELVELLLRPVRRPPIIKVRIELDFFLPHTGRKEPAPGGSSQEPVTSSFELIRRRKEIHVEDFKTDSSCFLRTEVWSGVQIAVAIELLVRIAVSAFLLKRLKIEIDGC